MKNLLLASTSTIWGGQYLEYIQYDIADLFGDVDEIIFIPYARPSGISHKNYTAKVSEFFSRFNIRVRGLHSFKQPAKAFKSAKGIFAGGGNTFLLVKQLHDLGLMKEVRKAVENGTPYLGTSAGTNIAGINMCNTNDMPIVYPPSFKCMGLVPFNFNPHYLDPDPQLQHNGETRETRIKEFLTQNKTPVVGLREGSWVRVNRGKNILLGNHAARIFTRDREPYELPPGSPITLGVK